MPTEWGRRQTTLRRRLILWSGLPVLSWQCMGICVAMANPTSNLFQPETTGLQDFFCFAKEPMRRQNYQMMLVYFFLSVYPKNKIGHLGWTCVEWCSCRWANHLPPSNRGPVKLPVLFVVECWLTDLTRFHYPSSHTPRDDEQSWGPGRFISHQVFFETIFFLNLMSGIKLSLFELSSRNRYTLFFFELSNIMSCCVGDFFGFCSCRMFHICSLCALHFFCWSCARLVVWKERACSRGWQRTPQRERWRTCRRRAWSSQRTRFFWPLRRWRRSSFRQRAYSWRCLVTFSLGFSHPPLKRSSRCWKSRWFESEVSLFFLSTQIGIIIFFLRNIPQ